VIGVDQALGARARIRILLELYKVVEINTTSLAKALDMNYGQLDRHLRLLIKAGLVEEYRIGRVRIVRLKNDPRVLDLVKALAAFGEGKRA
jgi:DNA-binding transcriptional ArsR family regulator